MTPLRHLLLVLALTPACINNDGPTDDGSTNGIGGKGDGPGSDPTCPSRADMVLEAREQLVREQPDVFDIADFQNGFGERIADLNSDGIDDLVIWPGSSGNDDEIAVMYLSDKAGCTTTYVGYFQASVVMPSKDGARTNEVRDLTIETMRYGCEVYHFTYHFDGRRYVEGVGKRVMDLCG